VTNPSPAPQKDKSEEVSKSPKNVNPISCSVLSLDLLTFIALPLYKLLNFLNE
jgi:hypothetical protein